MLTEMADVHRNCVLHTLNMLYPEKSPHWCLRSHTKIWYFISPSICVDWLYTANMEVIVFLSCAKKLMKGRTAFRDSIKQSEKSLTWSYGLRAVFIHLHWIRPEAACRRTRRIQNTELFHRIWTSTLWSEQTMMLRGKVAGRVMNSVHWRTPIVHSSNGYSRKQNKAALGLIPLISGCLAVQLSHSHNILIFFLIQCIYTVNTFCLCLPKIFVCLSGDV